MRRLAIDPADIEVIVCSHGHLDHTGGFDGLIRRLGGTVKLPVVIHPHFWRRRRLRLPGLEDFELPTTSRRALLEAGFEIIEERQPSFLFERSVLVTGEVARTSGYEPGFPPQQAWVDGAWQPDPLVLDDQALIVDIKDKGLLVITGCGHAGIVNICRYARRLTKEQAAVRGHRRLPSQRSPLRAAHPPGPRRPPGLAPARASFPPTARAGGPNMRWPPVLARRSSPIVSGPASISNARGSAQGRECKRATSCYKRDARRADDAVILPIASNCSSAGLY